MATTAIKVETPSEIRDALAARRRQLGLRQLELDDMAGVQAGYSGKVEKNIRGFGDMSLSCIMGALGFELLLVERPEPHQTPKAILGNLRESLDRLGLDLVFVEKARLKRLSAPERRTHVDPKLGRTLPQPPGD